MQLSPFIRQSITSCFFTYPLPGAFLVDILQETQQCWRERGNPNNRNVATKSQLEETVSESSKREKSRKREENTCLASFFAITAPKKHQNMSELKLWQMGGGLDGLSSYFSLVRSKTTKRHNTDALNRLWEFLSWIPQYYTKFFLWAIFAPGLTCSVCRPL